MQFINKRFVCDMDAIQPEYIIVYDSIVQDSTCEYCYLVNSKWW